MIEGLGFVSRRGLIDGEEKREEDVLWKYHVCSSFVLHGEDVEFHVGTDSESGFLSKFIKFAGVRSLSDRFSLLLFERPPFSID